jgi:peptidoglycan/LPS O-acetylase OafA/YrhL
MHIRTARRLLFIGGLLYLTLMLASLWGPGPLEPAAVRPYVAFFSIVGACGVIGGIGALMRFHERRRGDRLRAGLVAFALGSLIVAFWLYQKPAQILGIDRDTPGHCVSIALVLWAGFMMIIAAIWSDWQQSTKI